MSASAAERKIGAMGLLRENVQGPPVESEQRRAGAPPSTSAAQQQVEYPPYFMMLGAEVSRVGMKMPEFTGARVSSDPDHGRRHPEDHSVRHVRISIHVVRLA